MLHYKENNQTETTHSIPKCPIKSTNTSQQLQSSVMPSRYQKKCSVQTISGTGPPSHKERRSTLSAAINQTEVRF